MGAWLLSTDVVAKYCPMTSLAEAMSLSNDVTRSYLRGVDGSPCPVCRLHHGLIVLIV